MSPAVDFICKSDSYIIACLSKRFRVSSYQDIVYDAIQHAKEQALRLFRKPDITNTLYHILSDSAFRYFSHELKILTAEKEMRDETYHRTDTDVDFSQLPHYKEFYNSRTDIEKLIMETRSGCSDPLLVQIITGYDSKSIAVRIYQLRNKYREWLPGYIAYSNKFNQNFRYLNGSTNRKIARMINDGFGTSHIAEQLQISPKYTAVLVCRVRKAIMD